MFNCLCVVFESGLKSVSLQYVVVESLVVYKDCVRDGDKDTDRLRRLQCWESLNAACVRLPS